MNDIKTHPKVDLSFLSPEPRELAQESILDIPAIPDPRESPSPLSTLGVLTTSYQTASEGQPIQVKAIPRVEADWKDLLTTLRKERELAWKLYDRQRGLDYSHRTRHAKLEDINAAKAEIPRLQKRIAVVKRRLSPWAWCPLRRVPILQCHFQFKDDGIQRYRRLWTKRRWDQYFMLILSMLMEELASAQHASKLPACNRHIDGKYNFSEEYIAAERRFEAADHAHGLALKQFDDFKRSGPPVESPDDEIARRLAKYQAADPSVEYIATPTKSSSASSGGVYYQSHRPQVHIERQKC
jgi:hypothetical protein